MRRSTFAALLLTGALLGTAFPSVVRGDAVPPTGYDIEVQMLYCINAAQPCNTPPTLTNSLYVQAEAISFHPDAVNGTPDAVDFTCGKIAIDSKHQPRLIDMHVFASTKIIPAKAGFDPGSISGMAALGPNPTEQNTHARSTIHVRATDARTGDSAVVDGQMVSNNVTDLRVSGGFTVDLHGPIYSESPNGPSGGRRV